jgi:DNA-binding GntR family transcriptional regulator
MPRQHPKKPARPQLSQEAAAHVRALIMSGELRPGTPVLAESIAEDLGISTTPAREGLQALRVEGFLDLIPRHGFQVAPLNAEDIRDLFQIQGLIAGELAARAAAAATDEDVEELDALHHELIAAARRNDQRALEEKNHAFHRAINLMAGSRKIIWALGLLSRYVPREFYASITGWPQATVEDHSALLESIRQRDAAAARAAMREHVSHSGELLADYFDRRGAAPTATSETAEATQNAQQIV